MDEYTTPPTEGSPMELGEGIANTPRVSLEDKLRLIADTVDGQSSLGTELANFKRRLSLILEL